MYAYKTCKCEDFPCCGHDDVDPYWEPDPYSGTDDDYGIVCNGLYAEWED